MSCIANVMDIIILQENLVGGLQFIFQTSFFLKVTVLPGTPPQESYPNPTKFCMSRQREIETSKFGHPKQTNFCAILSCSKKSKILIRKVLLPTKQIISVGICDYSLTVHRLLDIPRDFEPTAKKRNNVVVIQNIAAE